MSGWLAVDKASVISRHIPGMCQEAAESTYVLESDLRLWAEMPGKCLRDKCDIYMFMLACSTPKALKLWQVPLRIGLSVSLCTRPDLPKY